MANKIPKGKYSNYYMKSFITHNMLLKPTDQYEVAQIISLLKNKSRKGHNGISLSMLKYLSPALTVPIAILINDSLQEGCFPDAKIIPIHKSKDSMSLTVLKYLSPVLTLLITILINNVLQEGCFPDALKKLRLYPFINLRTKSNWILTA